MSGTGITCERLLESLPELALGILPGRERAAAMAHLQHCSPCRGQVREMARTVDGLVDLIPPSEPPAGFESRVLQRMGLPRRRRRRHTAARRIGRYTAAVVAALVIGAGGWAAGHTLGTPAPPPVTAAGDIGHSVLTAELMTSDGHSVGQAFAHTGKPPWVYLAVDDEAADHGVPSTVRCQIVRGDGSTVVVGSFRADGGYAGWGGPYPEGSAPLTAIRLLAPDGSVVASASLAR